MFQVVGTTNDDISISSKNTNEIQLDIKYLKQLNIYKGYVFELNEVYGDETNIFTKEE